MAVVTMSDSWLEFGSFHTIPIASHFAASMLFSGRFSPRIWIVLADHTAKALPQNRVTSLESGNPYLLDILLNELYFILVVRLFTRTRLVVGARFGRCRRHLCRTQSVGRQILHLGEPIVAASMASSPVSTDMLLLLPCLPDLLWGLRSSSGSSWNG